VFVFAGAEPGETSAFDQIHADDRFKVLEAAREARSGGVARKLEHHIQPVVREALTNSRRPVPENKGRTDSDTNELSYAETS
jgi:hypothetical protein